MEKQNWIYAGFITLLAYINDLNACLLIVFLVLMGIDYLLGVSNSIINGTFKSSIMRIGIVRKAKQTLLLIALLLGEVVLKESGINIPVGSYIISIFCLYELSSISESAPPKIKKIFQNLISKLSNEVEK